MTNEEAIVFFKDMNECTYGDCEPVEMAIRALKQKSILKKIKEEILDEANYAYADFDKYKKDILDVEPDELPNDDFRYGMHRAFDIINKYQILLQYT